jgi:sugar transferase (PEP-CTERM system associated)
MIRIFHVHFPGRTLLLAASEAALVTGALIGTSVVWFGKDASLMLNYERGLVKIMTISMICMLCMYYYDLYDSFVLHNRREALTRLVQVLGTACVALALLFYVFPTTNIGRGPLLSWIVVAGICLSLCRMLYLLVTRVARLNRRALLLGNGALAGALSREIAARPELGLLVHGCIQTEAESDERMEAKSFGFVGDLKALVEREHIDQIIIAMEERRGKLPINELLALKARGIRIADGARTYEAITGRVPMVALHPSWLLLSDGFRVSRLMLIYKRLGSLLVSTIGLILSAPLMALVAIAVRLDSPGAVLFRQARVGKHGKVFTLYKFRSMIYDPDSTAQEQPALKEDKRFTGVGRWIRRTRLDELPQLYNVFIGDMYLIGPRPFTCSMEADLAIKIPFYDQRWTVKPGATGWAQVQRGYCVTLEDNIEKLSYDLFYVKNMSVGLDCIILFKTAKILLLGRGGQ